VGTSTAARHGRYDHCRAPRRWTPRLAARGLERFAAASGGLRYATFLLDDGVSFVHIAQADADPNPLPQTAAFQEFQREIADRCEEQPQASEVQEVGAYASSIGAEATMRPLHDRRSPLSMVRGSHPMPPTAPAHCRFRDKRDSNRRSSAMATLIETEQRRPA
jgi:hypothetical protein